MATIDMLSAKSAVMTRQPVANPIPSEAGCVASNRLAFRPGAVDDPAFDHWVVVYGLVIGDAHSVAHRQDGVSFALVRLFSMPDVAAYESIDSEKLRPKAAVSSVD